MLVSLTDASKSTGIPPQMISGVANRNGIKRFHRNMRVHFRSDDLESIYEICRSQPQPDDPTPEQIRERCQIELARRVTPGEHLRARHRKRILELFLRYPVLTARSVANQLGWCATKCNHLLDELEAVGLLDHEGDRAKRYFLPDTESGPDGLESPDSILGRFRERAQRRCRKRELAAA